MKHLLYFKVPQQFVETPGLIDTLAKIKIERHKRVMPAGFKILYYFVKTGLDGEDFVMNQQTVVATLTIDKSLRISRLKQLKHENERAKNRNNFPYHNVAKTNASTFHNSANPNCVRKGFRV